MLRGTGRQEIFHDDEDRLKFLETLVRYRERHQIKVYCWCLMGNHVHLLIGEGNESISATMKRIGVSFARFYNWKYNTTGHLFQDRFKSENVEDDEYLLTVMRYIHRNPVKSGIVKRPGDWKWSSYNGYYYSNNYPQDLLDSELILGIFSEDENNAIKRFIEYNESVNEDKCLDDDKVTRLTDEEARKEIKHRLHGCTIEQIKSLPKEERDKMFLSVKGIEGLSQRQAARILGISPNLIFRV